MYHRKPISITASVGVAEMGQDTPTLMTLIDKADQALYVAKESGRDQVAWQ